MDAPKLVPNAGDVLAKSSSLWAVYGAFIVDVGIKVLQYLQENRDLKWQDAIIPIALILATAFRVIPQRSITSATERKLLEERLTRRQLEVVATSEGPPISADQVKAIKREAAAAVKE